jgi:hypothetical protein
LIFNTVVSSNTIVLFQNCKNTTISNRAKSHATLRACLEAKYFYSF